MSLDAVVVGAGPNGLAAAIELAGRGLSVRVFEANAVPGGAVRTEESTVPGLPHDVGSSVYPMAVGSPFLGSLPLEDHGLRWLHPDVCVAHPLDGGRAVALYQDLDRTAEALGTDAAAYRRLLGVLTRRWPTLARHVLDSPLRIPTAPVLMARFAVRGLRSAASLAESTFETQEARALLGGCAAHSGLPLDQPPSAAVALVLMAAGHARGWPVAAGGAGRLTDALVGLLESRGGRVETDHRVRSLDDLPPARAVLLDLTPRQVVAVAGDRLPGSYARTLEDWKYGPGAFKVDWALDGPVPWTAEVCRRAGTVHVGGTFDEMAESERAPWEGRVADTPYVLLTQPGVVDPARAPGGTHAVGAYCHVPNAWTGDATDAIEAHVERHAPGFRARIRARRVHDPAELERWNANLVGGDVNGGALTLSQTGGRPVWSRRPWMTPVPHLYLCSAATPPGGGVHGMCGWHAAREALKWTFRR